MEIGHVNLQLRQDAENHFHLQPQKIGAVAKTDIHVDENSPNWLLRAENDVYLQ